MKKKLLTFLLGTTLTMGLAACGGGDDNGNGNGGGDETASASEGAKIYDQKCSSCHGGDLTGGMGPDLTKVGSKYSKDEILSIIENGKGAMPPNVVTGDDAEQVAEWLSAKK
ncbi:cytochrome c [Neobacillus sedimentimangrovi]|jgi:cytochrome c551|uniref:Cytochrome c n=1 Tax=Neobacillus sedimentimangrovi TaxID=2699460 RepID=A0ABS8QHT7_9BACI|nr:cytochrome c [Neobacillus sedimentimangrovi]AIM16217.1 cytochrome C551 [Bacillus sp. X1(2014)]MCD4838836.1 cytochrome c [Neobacillus sedimentimangrovi]